MEIIATDFPEVKIIEPKVFKDPRGFFMETYQERRYRENTIPASFVQDNISFSVRDTIRGLHFQYPNGQAKLVQALMGEIFDVVVDIRKGSPTFGKWIGAYLSEKNNRQLFIPEGFAHGFCVISEKALFSYKCGNYYSPKDECGVLWNDSDVRVQWPVKNPIVSDKDQLLKPLNQIPEDRLPEYKP